MAVRIKAEYGFRMATTPLFHILQKRTATFLEYLPTYLPTYLSTYLPTYPQWRPYINLRYRRSNLTSSHGRHIGINDCRKLKYLTVG